MLTPVLLAQLDRSSLSTRHRIASIPGALAVHMRAIFCLFLVWTLICQTVDSNFGSVQGNPLASSTTSRSSDEGAGLFTRLARAFPSFFNNEPPVSFDSQTDTLTDAVISRSHPNIHSGRIEGSLRVLRAESFTIGGSPQIWGDLFLPGTPSIQLNGGAEHGGVVSDGGATLPNYSLSLSGGIVLPGKIHIHSDAVTLPSDFPLSVPSAAGLRSVTVSSQSDVDAIGNWQTVRDLSVTKSGLTINVPPGNYGTFTVNGNSRLNFTAGTYNFANTFNLDGSASLQATGRVTINVGENLTINSGALVLGAYTSPGNIHLNVLGSTLKVNGSSQVSAMVRVYDGVVILNGTSQVRGQVIAESVTLNGGKVVGAVWPAQSGDSVKVFGPRRFDRTTGPPNQYLEQFSLPAGVTSPYTLRIQNGEANGSNRVSSATVKLNGKEILSQNDLNQTVATIDRAVSPTAANTLEVRLNSNPGSYLIINIAGVTTPTDTRPPLLSIISPSNNTTTKAETIDVSGTVSDTGTPASGVADVYVNGLEATLNSANSTWSISDIPLSMGANQITVRALDAAGNETTATINVTREAQNSAPLVDAGPDQTLVLPQTASLHGVASDDGFPEGSSLSTTWTIVSNPGSVAFTAVNSLNTIAGFGSSGTYVLRLTASDGELSTSDDITITVQPQNHPPTVSAGQNQTIALPRTATLNGTVADDGLPEGNSVASLWSQVSGPGTTSFEDPLLSETVATFSVSGVYVLRLTATDSDLNASSEVTITVHPENQAPTANAGVDQTISLPDAVQLNGSSADDGWPYGSSLSVTWSAVSGPGSVVFASPEVTVTSASFSVAGTYVLRLTATDSELTTSDDVVITVTPPNQAPVVNAGNNQTITLPAAANLNGTVADDGLPLGSSVSMSWSKVSGPGAVAFHNASQPATSAQFSIAGDYVLRLTAGDSDLTGTDDVHVTVIPENSAPTANAGVDQTITMPQTALLNGSVTDDGLPYGSSLNSSWSKVSGPGEVVFSSPHTTTTTASFCTPGTYVLRLTATDSLLSVSDELTVTVKKLHTQTFQSGNGEIGQQDAYNVASRDGGLTYHPAYVIETYQSWLIVPGTNFFWEQIPGTKWINWQPNYWAAEPFNWFTTPTVTKYRLSFTLPADYSNPALLGRISADERVTIRLNGTQIGQFYIAAHNPGGFLSTNDATLFRAGQNLIEFDVEDLCCGTHGLDYRVTISANTAAPLGNQAPTVKTGETQTISSWPNAAPISGDVSDDGLPCNTPLNILWSNVTGPGTVSFANANARETTATFSTPGVYILRLSASDSQFATSDEMRVEVQPPNQAPVVNAGPDQLIRQPEGVGLNGSVTDDGLPTGQPVSVQWTKQSGPGAVSFANPNSPTTSATFSLAGTYVLRLSASDSIFNTSDEVTVTVYPLTPACPSDDFTDDFNDNALDSTKWLISDPASTVTVREQNQRLEMTLRPNTIAYNGVSSTAKFDFRDKRFEVNVPQAANQNGFTETYFTLTRDSSNYYLFLAGSNSLVLDAYTSGVRDRTVLNYNSTADRFWRIRHDAAGNAIHFESGADGLIWTKRKSVTVSFPLTALTLNLFAGAWGSGNGAPGMAVFDNLRLVPLVPNCLPSVELTNPANNATFASGSNISLSATAGDSDGQITKVEFFTNGVKLGEVTTAPYTFVWNNVAAGSYALYAKATDNAAATATSAVVEITVNQPPTVSAGVDQTITLPALANLQGAAADDGRPANILTTLWSKVSGPGNVTFGNVNAVATTAEFSSEGIYVLRLTASDTHLLAGDDIQVTVNPVPSNQPPNANAGPDLFATIYGNLISNGGNDQPLGNGEIHGWIEAQGTTWMSGSANIADGFPEPQRGSAYFFAGDTAQAELRQDIDVSAYAGNIAAGNQQFEFKAYVRSAVEATPDSARVIVEYRNSANTTVLATLDSGEITSTPSTPTDAWHLTEDTRAAPVGTGWIRVRLIATRNSGSSNDAFFDSISLRPAGNAGVKLTGVTTDDGLPYGSTLTSAWTIVSGPGAVTFANADAPVSGASFIVAGTYVLRLTASDGQLSTGDDVTMFVSPANQAPLVNAGASQTITMPASANLNGMVTDDGQPSGTIAGSVSINWTKVSGPGNVTFADAGEATTTASFSTAGTYMLRLTADDTEYSASDEVIITVNPEPVAVNQPPAVNPGPNQTIALPTDTVALSGTVTDDGLPAGSTLIVTWTKVSGPGAITFADPNSAVTTAQFSVVGNYVLRLSASDGAYLISADVGVTLTPQNLSPLANAGPDQTILLSQPAQLNGSASDDGLPSGSVLTTTWSKVSGPGTVTFTNANVTVAAAMFSATGAYVLRLTASDGALSAGDDLTITVNDDVAPPVVEIKSPADGDERTELTSVIGSVSNGTWILEYSLNSDDGAASQVWTEVSSGIGPVTNSSLGTLDTTLMLNGLYSLRLRATDTYGQVSFTSISVLLDKNFKVGQFQVAFSDLNVPVAGLPVEVVRSYDSRDKRMGDFGVGWQLGLRSARVEKTGILGLGWTQTVTSGFVPTYCLEPTRPHKVAITFGDGKVFKFRASTAIHCQQAAPISATQLSFIPEPGTHATLESTTAADVLVAVQGSIPGPVHLINHSDPDIYNTSSFRLTTAEGAVYVIDQRTGVSSVRDVYGNSLTINSGGIVHSSGQSIAFIRDGAGRITQITDPNGNAQTYGYDANGDLISYTDREQQTTAFTYSSHHHLLSITDARGVELLTNQYDADGRLVGQDDAFGKSLVYDHDVAGRVETITNRLGHQTRYEYDERGNVLRHVDPKGGIKTFTYDANDNVLTETNALGKTTTYSYDAADNRTSVTDPLGNVTRLTYNAARQPLTVTDALGHVTTNTYDAAGTNLLTTTDPFGRTTTFTYNVFTGQRSSVKDALEHVTNYGYDSAGRLSSETDALGHVTTFGYDGNGNRITQTVTRTSAGGQAESITTSYTYDKLNRLTKTTFADGSFMRVEYNAIGQQAATIDQLGHRTEFTYDHMGRLSLTVHPDATQEETTYDEEGRQLTSKDRAGRITSFTYDELGRLTKTTYPDNTFTSTTYDAVGQVLTTIDARGNVTTYFYDNGGRRTKVRNALNQETTFTYDANGNQLSMTDALGHTTSYEYDLNNRRTKTTYADSSFDTVGYDALGRSVSKTDQAGKATQFTYDALGRLTKVKDALNQETSYVYNELGQPLSQTDANNRTTRFENDRLGRRVKRILPAGQFEIYSYDTGGNLQQRTDFNGKTTTFTHDAMRRLLSKFPDASLNQPAISFTYNSSGQRATMTDASGSTVYNYDGRSRLSSKQTPFGKLSYTYDDAGNLSTTHSSNTNGTSIDYAYDALNRLATVKDNRLSALSGGLATYNYDTVGNLQSYLYPNGVTTSYNYNSLNRLTSMNAGTLVSSLASYVYTLGAAGNRTAVSEMGGRTVNYTYDDLYRLTTETISNDPHGINGTVSYGYDPVGNRLSRTSSIPVVPSGSSTYDANDRLTSDTYDNNGNTTISNSNVYSYDFENHLTSLITHDSSLITFRYDGDGNRVAKTVGGVTTNYLVDTNNHTGYAQVVEELQGGAVVKQFTYGHDLISQRCAAAGAPANCSLSFYGYDGHGSVRYLTDSSAAITDTYSYDAFGNLISRTGTTSNDYLYSGEQLDPNLGFYYLRARYMDPSSGRFWSLDTFEGGSYDPASLHKYLYTRNNPTTLIDPSGHFSLVDTLNTSVLVGVLSGFTFGLVTGGLEGAINGAIQGAVMGALVPLTGAGVGTLALGNAARGVFVVGWGVGLGSAVEPGFNLATADNEDDRLDAGLGLLTTAAFMYFGPKLLQRANTKIVSGEQANDDFASLRTGNVEPPWPVSNQVTRTTIFTSAKAVRVYTEGSTSPVGYWIMEASEIQGLTAAQIQQKFALPFKPSHISVVDIPAGTTINIGQAGPNKFGLGGGMQVEIQRPNFPSGPNPSPRYRPGVPIN